MIPTAWRRPWPLHTVVGLGLFGAEPAQANKHDVLPSHTPRGCSNASWVVWNCSNVIQWYLVGGVTCCHSAILIKSLDTNEVNPSKVFFFSVASPTA